MRIGKVIQACGVWQCRECGKTVVGPLRDTLPGMLYDNRSIAEMVAGRSPNSRRSGRSRGRWA